MNDVDIFDIDILVVGRSVNLHSLSTRLERCRFTKRYRDVLTVEQSRGTAFIFDYGVIITWGLCELKRQALLEKIMVSVIEKKRELSWEHYQFEFSTTDSVSVVDDVVYVPDKEPLTLLSVSHVLAQSVILEQFEALAERTITENTYLSETLANTGKIPLSRKALAKLRGRLFQTKSDILLHFNLLDTPEFFWAYPDREASYNVVAKYFDLTPRVELLTLKLETIRELLEMLATEQNHKHSATLEWIIILLIAVDIAVYFGH
jgi:uncharacterized Rmd1/YagE family protein